MESVYGDLTLMQSKAFMVTNSNAVESVYGDLTLMQWKAFMET